MGAVFEFQVPCGWDENDAIETLAPPQFLLHHSHPSHMGA